MGWSDVPLGHLILLPFNWISVILYIFLVYFILVSRRTKSLFRSPFFSIVLAQAFWDLSMFFVAFFIVFCRKFRLIQYPEGENFPLTHIIYFIQTLIPICMYCNCLLYAASRLSAFYFPMSLDQLWKPRNVIIAMIIIVTFASLLVGSLFYGVDAEITLKNMQETGRMEMFANDLLIQKTCMQDLLLSIISCVICCCVYIHLAVKKSATMAKYQKTFFRCAVTVFVPYIPNAIKSLTLFIASANENKVLVGYCVDSWLYVIYLMCLTSPWALILTCPALRPRTIFSREPTTYPRSGSKINNLISHERR